MQRVQSAHGDAAAYSYRNGSSDGYSGAKPYAGGYRHLDARLHPKRSSKPDRRLHLDAKLYGDHHPSAGGRICFR